MRTEVVDRRPLEHVPGLFSPTGTNPHVFWPLPPRFGMFSTTSEQRFLWFSTGRSAQLAWQWTGLLETLSHATKTAQIPHWGSLSLCISFSTSKHLETHFSKPGSLSSGVVSSSEIRAHNKKTMELVLSHMATFSAYFKEGGSHFP